MPLTVTADDIDNLIVATRPAFSITGHAQYRGRHAAAYQRIAGVHGSAFALEPVEGARATFTGSAKTGEGVVTMGGLLPGRYRVRVTNSPPGWMFKGAMLNGVDVSETPFE